MDKVYEELDEAKAEIEELKVEIRAKTNSLENLKKSHNAQVNQIQETKSKAEKLEQKLLQQEDEISETKMVCEDLRGNLNKKESIIKCLSAANDKLRVDCDEKFKKWEEEKRGLLLALEEVNENTQNQEEQIHHYKQENERLKGCLSVSKEKCLDAKENLKASKEQRERDDMFHKLEEECRKAEDQLKWKKEQFKHLEEAHEKLRGQFKSSKKEWEMEKSTLLDGISSLESRLDSQIRISDDLQRQLHSCHQAVAHVESQKKRLEVEVSNLKVQLDNASNEYQDARLQLDCLNTDRDKDIADLRYLLKTKEAYHKESKYKIEKLEQENQELRMSLKELQEAQIQEVGASYSQSKLRSKLKNLEQTRKECASTLKAKEAEWNFQLKQLTENLNKCQSDLETKTEAVEDLQMELERSHSLAIEMKLSNEEMYVILLVLKHGISEAQLKLASHKSEMFLINRASEENIFQLMRQLEMKDAALISAQKSISEEREIAACLMRQLEASVSNNELQKELDRHKEMLEESTMSPLILEEKVLQMECNFKEQLEMKDAALISAQESISKEHEIAACLRRQVESYVSNNEQQPSLRNEVERHKEMLEESATSQVILKEKVLQMECNYKEQLKEIHDALDSVIIELDETICERNDMEFELQIWKSIVERLKNDLEENHVVRRELESSLLAQVDVAESLKQEKDSLVQIIEEKDKILEELQKNIVWVEQESLRKEFESAVIEKATMEKTFEHDIHAMQLKLQEEKWSQSEQQLELGAKHLKAMELNDEMETKLRKSDSLLQKLKMENKHLLESATRLSSERENLLAFVQGINDKICEFSTADTTLMDMLRSMVQSFENGCCPVMNLKKDDDGFLVKENMLIQSPTSIKKLEANSDTRSPFKELNMLEQ